MDGSRAHQASTHGSKGIGPKTMYMEKGASTSQGQGINPWSQEYGAKDWVCKERDLGLAHPNIYPCF
jgi:hypothetical protein